MDGKQVATVCNTNDLIVQWSKLYPDDNSRLTMIKDCK